MKKLFNLKMVENASVAQHLNEFNTITNQLSYVEINFDDEICALIILASLPNNWEAMGPFGLNLLLLKLKTKN